MTTPYKLLSQPNDPWWLKAEKKVARWLWNDLTRRQDHVKPAEGYPGADPPPDHLLDSFGHWVHRRFDHVLRQTREEDKH